MSNNTFIQGHVNFYPNPTFSKINIDLGNQSNFIGSKIKVTNILGQEIYNSMISQQIIEIPLSSIATRGLYFISLINGENKVITTKKIFLN
ncbi:T9SS type A sorting domain-containing protein [Flavobacterium psychrotolerans]|uniref:T9SS type A sorting domain-containing protein n=1 Tax=Flavobacterium psychrotolerans TaxID=2169410 RepID=UPI00140C75F8